MSDGVADIVRKSAYGKSEFVGVTGVTKEIYDEIAGADVVGQIRERRVAKRIVADILYDTSAVCICASVLELSWGEAGITAKEQRDDRLLPGEINKLLVGEQRVCAYRWAKREEHDYKQKKHRAESDPRNPQAMVSARHPHFSNIFHA